MRPRDYAPPQLSANIDTRPFHTRCAGLIQVPRVGNHSSISPSSAIASWTSQPELCSSFITSVIHRRVCGAYHCTIAIHLPGCPGLGPLEDWDKVSYTFVWPASGTGPSSQHPAHSSAPRKSAKGKDQLQRWVTFLLFPSGGKKLK